MSWRDIVRKSGCTAKMGTCSCEECLNKAPKPDYIDIDGDGNKTESMKEAAKDKVKKMKVRRKEPSDNKCPKCGKKGSRFMGANPLLCENPDCSEYNPEELRSHGYETYPRKNPFTRKD